MTVMQSQETPTAAPSSKLAPLASVDGRGKPRYRPSTAITRSEPKTESVCGLQPAGQAQGEVRRASECEGFTIIPPFSGVRGRELPCPFFILSGDKMKKLGKGIGFLLLFVLVVLFSVLASHAQTPAGSQFSVSGSYASSSGNNTNNGMQNTVEWNLSGRWGARLDLFGLNKPAGTTWQLAEGQYKIPGDRLFKTTDPTFAKILVGLHAGLGALKSPNGAMNFAAGAGASVDYNVTSMLFVRVFDMTVGYSRGIGLIGPVGTNVNVGAGVGINF